MVTAGSCTPPPAGDNRPNELGHTLGLRHGRSEDLNCKPNHPGVMNYDKLPMLRSLYDAVSGVPSSPHRATPCHGTPESTAGLPD